MKLVQFYVGNALKVGLVEGNDLFDITSPEQGINESKDIICKAAADGSTVASVMMKTKEAKGNCAKYAYDVVFNGQDKNIKPAIPVFAEEVWGCGVTYENAAMFRDEDKGQKQHEGSAHGYYARAHFAERPEIFYKGSISRCVPTLGNGGIRSDAKVTLCEPELCLIINKKGEIIGYTIGDDLSAWDLERENPLYLPQCKVYNGGIVLGPAIVLSEDIKNPYNLKITCTIKRAGKVIFDGEANTSGLKRKFEELAGYVTRCQPEMDIWIVFTGTGMIIPLDAALEVGDIVEFNQPEIGTLVHGMELV